MRQPLAATITLLMTQLAILRPRSWLARRRCAIVWAPAWALRITGGTS